ncbi:MAG: two-component regulator propeller domain-containing protein [Planctomycetota bacterium]
MQPTVLHLTALLLLVPQDGETSLGVEVDAIDPRIWCLHEARDGHLWLGSNGSGLYRCDGERVVHYTRDDGLEGLQVRSITEDKDGNLFFATSTGVTRFDGERFTELTAVPAGDDGWTLDPDDVWLVFAPGTHGPCRYDGERLYLLELTQSPYVDPDGPGANFPLAGVYQVYRDRRGHVWFGTAGAGLCRYDGETLAWMYEERLTTTPSGGAFGIRSIFEDRAGDFWVCNTRQRFEIDREAREEGGHVRIGYTKREGLPLAGSDTAENFAYYQSMLEDEAGALWMACGDCVRRFDGEEVTRFAFDEGVYVASLLYDREGRLWASTLEHGVFRLAGGRFEPFRPGSAR